MTEQQGRRRRRLRALPAAPVPETAESVLPELPRVGALDALLREVDSLRLSLETDLTLAASAVEAGAPQIAIDIVDSERAALRSFEKRALGHVEDLASPRRRFRVPAAPFVAAAAVAGFLLGVVPHTQLGGEPAFTTSGLASPNASLDRLQEAAASGQTTAAVDAAAQLHEQLRVLVANAGGDSQVAAQALNILYAERTALAMSGDSLAVQRLLAESERLSTMLLKHLPSDVAAKVSPTRTLPPVQVVASPKPSPSSSPKPSPTSSPKAKPASSPSPASSRASSSPSPSSSTPGLPGTPGLG